MSRSSTTTRTARTKYSHGGVRPLATLLALTWAVLTCADAIGASDLVRRRFDIPAQPLATALLRFSEQAAVQLAAPSALLTGVQTQGVSGDHTVDSALQALLRGTGLTFRAIDKKTIAIRKDDAAVAAGSGVTGGNGSAESDKAHALQTEGAEAVPGPATDTRRLPSLIGEVVVTGSHIRGTDNIGSPVIRLGRDYIDRSGYSSLQDLVTTLPQNFGAGAREDRNSINDGQGAAGAFGAGVNLRGLGTDSTLVLLNGRRVAPSGQLASFVDVSLIPLTAVERVDVLTDGASALYGSDALGGVVNFVMRDLAGSETTVRFGSAQGGVNEELKATQTLGTSWNTGNAFLAYEYLHHDNLPSEEREAGRSSDLTRFGGQNFSATASNPGNIYDLATFSPSIPIPAGQDGTNLTPEQLVPGVSNLQNTRQGTDLLPEREQHSVFATISQEIGEHATLFADLHYGSRGIVNYQPADSTFLIVPPSNAFFVDPFGGSPILVLEYSFLDDLGPIQEEAEAQGYGATLGLDFGLGAGSWQAQAYGSLHDWDSDVLITNVVNQPALELALADSNPATAFNPFADGSSTNPATLDAIRGLETSDSNSRIWTAHVKADGDLFQLPAGSAKLALGAEYRDEIFVIEVLGTRTTPEPTRTFFNEGERDVLAGFAELLIPVISPANERKGFHRLDLSLAARYEDYSDFGTTLDPRFGVRWAPVEWASLRGSVGTSFKAPLLSQVEESTVAQAFAAVDPGSSTGFSNVIALVGISDGIGAEEAETWTLGVDFGRPGEPGPAVSFNYFSIEIKDRIQGGVDNFNRVLGDQATYAPVTTLDPTEEQVVAWFNDPDWVGGTVDPASVVAIIDGRVRNVAVVELRGMDLQASHSMETSADRFDMYVNGTYFFDVKQAITSTAELVEQVSTIYHPADLKARAGFTWSNRGFSATAAVNYVDDYQDTNPTLPLRVDAWTTVDLQLSYVVDGESAPDVFDGIRLAINVTNALDEDPPFANIPLGVAYDSVNADPTGRFIALQVSKQW